MNQGHQEPGGKVAVVTGAANGIGAAIALELGRRGVHVVALDAGVTVDGTARDVAGGEPTTAEQILRAGGQARTHLASVTDLVAMQTLFASLAEEFGGVDIVVNAAGINRGTRFASGSGADWVAELDVHVTGYLNVLAAALPVMRPGRGRILGFTSGAGWRASDAGAYSCAKRAIASLTWMIGRAADPGTSINALSPVAATRMVTTTVTGGGQNAPDFRTTGGLTLTALPPPCDLAEVGALLVSDEVDWCRGEVIFSSGWELAPVVPPRPLEIVPVGPEVDLRRLLERAIPDVLVPTEVAQRTSGGNAPRFYELLGPGATGAPAAPTNEGPRRSGRCLVVTDDDALEKELAGAVAELGLEPVSTDLAWAAARSGAAEDFEQASAVVERAAELHGPFDAIVVAGPTRSAGDGASWQSILTDHDGIAARIVHDAAWSRAAVNHATNAGRTLRLVTVVDAASPGGRSRAQASAQLARASRVDRSAGVDAFAVAVESASANARGALVQLVAQLLANEAAAELAGSEFRVSAEWIALCSHPAPVGSVNVPGPELPPWTAAALRRIVPR